MRQCVIERQQVVGGEMDAAVGIGTAQGGFVASAVNVDVTPEGIHVTAAIEARLQSLQPEDAVGDGRPGQAAPSVADEPAGP